MNFLDKDLLGCSDRDHTVLHLLDNVAEELYCNDIIASVPPSNIYGLRIPGITRWNQAGPHFGIP